MLLLAPHPSCDIHRGTYYRKWTTHFCGHEMILTACFNVNCRVVKCQWVRCDNQCCETGIWDPVLFFTPGSEIRDGEFLASRQAFYNSPSSIFPLVIQYPLGKVLYVPGGTHSLAGEGGPNSDKGTDTVRLLHHAKQHNINVTRRNVTKPSCTQRKSPKT